MHWTFLGDDSLTLDQKCETFHAILDDVFNRTIPCSYIKCSNKDKPWITSVIKCLINKRWNAYRIKNFVMYNRLKDKIRKEIAKSKTLWTKRMKSRDLWKAVHTNIVTILSNPIMALLSLFGNVSEAVEQINSSLSAVFFLKLYRHPIFLHQFRMIGPLTFLP